MAYSNYEGFQILIFVHHILENYKPHSIMHTSGGYSRVFNCVVWLPASHGRLSINRHLVRQRYPTTRMMMSSMIVAARDVMMMMDNTESRCTYIHVYLENKRYLAVRLDTGGKYDKFQCINIKLSYSLTQVSGMDLKSGMLYCISYKANYSWFVIRGMDADVRHFCTETYVSVGDGNVFAIPS